METKTSISVTALMPPSLEHRTRLAAARQRISRAELVRLAVIEYLAKLESQGTQKPRGGQDE